MARKRRFGKKLAKSLLPIVLLLVLAVIGALAWLVFSLTRPPRRDYLVTPHHFSLISGPGLSVTDETWSNRDGTTARGWLLRGVNGAPAVVLMHRYGADRSWLFNLGVKLNETTSATVLWPDLRGHGMNPPVGWSSFGIYEGDDVAAALDFLRSVRSESGEQLIGDRIGLYGVGLGAYATMRAGGNDAAVRALVLDSVPHGPDDLLYTTLANEVGFDHNFLRFLARGATWVYFAGRYENIPACNLAPPLADRAVLLLSGADAGQLRDSTMALRECFQSASNLEVELDLPLTGYNLPSAPGEQGERYDRRVIDFFDRNLR